MIDTIIFITRGFRSARRTCIAACFMRRFRDLLSSRHSRIMPYFNALAPRYFYFKSFTITTKIWTNDNWKIKSICWIYILNEIKCVCMFNLRKWNYWFILILKCFILEYHWIFKYFCINRINNGKQILETWKEQIKWV